MDKEGWHMMFLSLLFISQRNGFLQLFLLIFHELKTLPPFQEVRRDLA
jgi:hypothetical protein